MAFGDIAKSVGIGAFFGGPIGAAFGLQYAGQKEAAEAQGRIAEAQLEEARRTRTLAQGAAEPTTQELIAMQNQLQLQERATARQEQLLDSIDPALLEASRQTLALLRGEESSTLAPLRSERERQRAQLMNQLIASQGSGAEFSSAGQEALNRFDAQTAAVLGQQQQATLGDLLRTTAGSRPDPYQAAAANTQSLAALGSIQARRVSAITGTPITPYAGAQFVQQGLQGQALAGIGQAASTAMIAGGTKALTAGAGGGIG